MTFCKQEEMSDLQFGLDVLRGLRKTCDNCWHHKHNDCAVNSCACIADIRNHKPLPSRWMSWQEGEWIEKKLMRW